MTCTANYKKFVSFEGKWKTITIDNAKEIMDALGNFFKFLKY